MKAAPVTSRRLGKKWLVVGFVLIACAAASWWGARRALDDLDESPPLDRPVRDAPNIKTPPDIAARMVELAELGPQDLVYDLGCGDGRLVIAAVVRHGCRGVGLDNDPQRLAKARENARAAGVEQRIEFIEANILEYDFSSADAVLLYLLPKLNEALVPQFMQLKPGARIVSSEFEIRGLMPETIERMTSTDSGERHVLYLYRSVEQPQNPAP